MATAPLSADEQQTREELLFSLHHRDKPTLAFVECKSTAKRDELQAWLQAALPEYEFVTLDLTPLTVGSLLRTLTEQLPAEVRESKPVRYVVNVHGLENRLDEALAAQLNLERELLFRNVPYIILVWADNYFFRRLQRLAPDLWHWVTYKFRFDDPTAQPVAQLPPLPPEPLPLPGNIEVRRQRIQELEDRYSHLDLSDDNKLRLLRDKLTIKSLLAAEYAEAFEFPQAIAAYRDALGMDEQIQLAAIHEDDYEGRSHTRGMLFFSLGSALYKNRMFADAKAAYEQSRLELEEDIYGFIDHQVGSVYMAEKNWTLALESYNSALAHYERAEEYTQYGATCHQIGMVYAEQENWSSALSKYEQAITWKNKTGKKSKLGITYHQIGVVYTRQGQWALALENYKLAIKSYEENNFLFDMGAAYHQMGIVSAQQMNWVDALENYTKALWWKRQVGNTIELAGTYYQIGVLYEEQSYLTEALLYFEQAVAHAANHPNLPLAQEALARVRAALANPPAE